MTDHNQANQLQDRLIDLGVAVIRISSRMPRSVTGRHLASQLMRSGTAPAAHYTEARGAESAADFAHKLAIAFKELNETQIWLRMIQKSNVMPADDLPALFDEVEQLSRIMAASLHTTRAKQRTPSDSSNIK